MRPSRRLATTLAGAAVTTLGVGLATAPDALAARPTFKMPFSCGYVATSATYSGHSPQNAVDWQKSGIEGDVVRASAAGTVTVSKDLGSRSYGRYLVVDHGGGWSTLYAHLSGRKVSVGTKVSRGTHIGWAGSTGGVTGPHLHWEQRLNGVAQKAQINGTTVLYYGKKSYKSDNAC